MSEVIVITSGKGGVGKTTSTSNIGAWLSILNKKVVVIDTDIGLRNLDVVMGLENRVVFHLVDVIEGNCAISQALIRDRHFPNLYLMPTAQTRDKTAVEPEQMKKLIELLKEDFDYILLDSPAGIEQGFQNAIAGANRAIVITTPDVAAIRDADRVAGLLEDAGLRDIKLLINRIRMDMVRRGVMMSMEDIADVLGMDVIGVVPDDEQVIICTNQGIPVRAKNSLAGCAYKNIALRITGEDVPLVDFNEKKNRIHKILNFRISKGLT
ncbi:MAG: septum site-determining protein MinD [Lachnospiraceae bacterium]|nr:septum site-determining protein MinD [Lachnospiraceae bacterium]MDD3615860.1 septum site-determining protein MinD [Lachnospiraceae bacterium]